MRPLHILAFIARFLLSMSIQFKNEAMRHLKLIITVFALSALALVSCNNDENLIPDDKGRLNVHITDAPFPIGLVGSTEVTIDRVEVRKQAEAGMDEDQDSFIIISSETVTIDLLNLTNGVTELMGSVDLDPGYYDQIRLHVVDATVTLKDGSTFDLKVPSGSTSGLKIKIQPSVYVEAGKSSDVLLDFDLSRSFVVKGKIDGKISGFNFKPVVRGIYLKHAGSVEGTVTDTTGTPIENAMVQIFVPGENEDGEDDDSMKSGSSDDDGEDEDGDKGPVSSFTDANGTYKIIGLPAGTYTVVCTHDEFVSDTITNVAVSVESETVVNFELLPDEDEVEDDDDDDDDDVDED